MVRGFVLAALVSLAVASCAGAPRRCVDADHDGYGANCPAGEDCRDDDATITSQCPDCDETPFATGCPCDRAEPESCYSGPAETVDVGPCRPGLRRCDDGYWTPCVGEVVPREEQVGHVDGVDDDCDGTADDGVCADAVACGEKCCLAGETCWGATCGAPRACAEAADCDDDARCEDGWCTPFGSGESDDACRPPVEPLDALEPELQCEWTGRADGIVNVGVTPIVGDLDAPGLDGVVEPEVVFIARTAYGGDAALVVMSGEDCAERCRYEASPDDDLYIGAGSVALGDVIEGGDLEIVLEAQKGHDLRGDMLLFDEECNVIWEVDVDCGVEGVSIADLDGEGDPEIVCSAAALDSSGEVLWQSEADWLALVADVDLDGMPEVVTPNWIRDGATGAAEAFFPGLDYGSTAVADLDPSTPEPEIVVSGRIQTIAGDVILPSSGLVATGVATVADVDADGQAEIVVGGNLAVVDPDCDPEWARGGECSTRRKDGILWDRVDLTFGQGATVFDLDADGVEEVISSDECFARILNGATGETRWATSHTQSRGSRVSEISPLCADTDGDGHAEIVMAGSFESREPGECPAVDPETGALFEGANAGVRIFRDALDRWPATRPIWNQQAYSVTNVDDFGVLPDHPESNWTVRGLNDFRRNPGPEALGRGIDLTVRSEGWTERCPDSISLRATVANRGVGRVLGGVRVRFYVDGPSGIGELACEASTTAALERGEEETVGCEWVDPGASRHEVYIHVDVPDAVLECEEENNDARLRDVGCDVAG